MSPSTTLTPDVANHPARVLIVDDERHNRQLLEAMLAPEGILTRGASTGEEALVMVDQQPPDLILLDIMMPGMDGYQVAAMLRGNLSTTSIPIIMVTALDDRRARMRGLNVGAEDFLTKPVDRAELCARVKNLLRLKAYGDHYDKYSRTLEREVVWRTEHLAQQAKQAAVLTEQIVELQLLTERLSLATAVARVGVWERVGSSVSTWMSRKRRRPTLPDVEQTESLASQPDGSLERSYRHMRTAVAETKDNRLPATRLSTCRTSSDERVLDDAADGGDGEAPGSGRCET